MFFLLDSCLFRIVAGCKVTPVYNTIIGYCPSRLIKLMDNNYPKELSSEKKNRS